MRRPRRAGRVLPILLLAACAPAPQADITLGQAVIELSDAVNGLRQENALLQGQIDSLRQEIARRDTLMRQIAAAVGVPVP